MWGGGGGILNIRQRTKLKFNETKKLPNVWTRRWNRLGPGSAEPLSLHELSVCSLRLQAMEQIVWKTENVNSTISFFSPYAISVIAIKADYMVLLRIEPNRHQREKQPTVNSFTNLVCLGFSPWC